MVAKALAVGRTCLVVGRRDGRLFRVDRATGAVRSWAVLASPVLGLALTPDESRALVGGDKGEVRFVDLTDGSGTAVPDAHRDAVPAVAVGPGFFVTGSGDRRVRLWFPDGRPVATFRMRGAVRKVLLSADGRSLLVHVEGERAVRRWRLDTLAREWAAVGIDPGITPR